MLEMYKTNMQTNKLEKTEKFEKGNWINLVAPTENEIKLVCKNLDIDSEFIRYPLDYEEKARIDIEDELKLFVIDVPIIDKDSEEDLYTTMPLRDDNS